MSTGDFDLVCEVDDNEASKLWKEFVAYGLKKGLLKGERGVPAVDVGAKR